MEQDRNGEYPHAKYIGVTLDRTLSYMEHIHNTKMKVATRNNLLRKLPNSKWGANANTIRTTALALCYSVAEYSTSLGEIISCPETELRAKQCMQSRDRMPEANQCRRPVLAGWNCVTRHPEKCMCLRGKDQTGNE